MTKDDIMQALRLTAMGRVGHPLQEDLANALVALFAQQGSFEERLALAGEVREVIPTLTYDDVVPVAKRTRKPKAE